MSNSYTRHDLGNGYFRFDLRAASGGSTGRNVWLSKLVDKGPAVLMTKATV